MLNRRTSAIPWIAVVLAMSLTGTASGQAGAQGASALEEIVVTARKREESLQDTPISITAFTGDALELQHIDRLDNIADHTPNLVFDTGSTFSGNNSAAAVFIRGIGQIDYTAEPGVGIYLDGVYIGTSVGSVLDLVDVERIEVLRGPQGTLFGRNTIGGAISVTSARPDETLHGDLKITTGAYDRIDVRGRINVPLTDTLFAKVSAATFNRKGFVDAPNAPSGDHLGDIDRDAVRAALRFTPNDRFEAHLSADYTRARENGVPHVLTGVFNGDVRAFIASLADPTSPSFVPPPEPLPSPNAVELHNLLATTPIGAQGGIAGVTPGVVPNPVFGQPTITDADAIDIEDGPLVNRSNIDLSSNTETLGFALSLSYDFDWGTVKSISSYREMDAFGGFDNDGLPIITSEVANDLAHEQFTQEIQLSGIAMDGRLKWLLGFYHFDEDVLNLEQVEFTGFHVLSNGKADNRSTAGFGQLTFDVTQRLSVTLGARYTDEEKKFIVPDECYDLPKGPATLFDGTVVTCAQLQSVIAPKFLNPGFLAFVNAPVFPAPGGRLCCLPVSDAQGNVQGLLPGLTPGQELLPRGSTTLTHSHWTPHANVAYRWTEELMTYFTYSEGFKSGGFLQRVFPPRTAVPSFEPETVESYEVGFKWDGFGNRVRVSAAGFHTKYDDLQIQVTDVAPVIRNAGSAEINGFELEVSAIPATGWLVQGGVGYLDAGYTELDEDENLVTDLRVLSLDSELANAPEWSTNLGVQYSYDVPRFGGRLVTRVDWTYRSEIYNDALNFPELRQGGYHLLDLGMTYVGADEAWEVSLFGKNITDERYINAGFANILLGGWAAAHIGRPAEWGLSFKYRFDG